MEKLIDNIDKIHTTKLGVDRIKSNLNINCDVVNYCKKLILCNDVKIYKLYNNYYCEKDNIRITINSYSYTIITAHLI